MPLSLTTPISAGDLDPGVASYAQVRVTGFEYRRRLLRFRTEVGNTVDAAWVRGKGRRTFTVDGAAFDTLVSTHSTLADELTYDAVERGLYEWLISEGHYAGTIV